MLLECLREYLKNENISLPQDCFAPYLNEGQAVILLDGLDEVADPALRGRGSCAVWELLTLAYPACRYVISSRVVGYSETARLGVDYRVTTVRDFNLEDVHQFLTRWHRLLAISKYGLGLDGGSRMPHARRMS